MNLAIFVSSGGSNFRTIHKAILAGDIEGEIRLVITDRPTCLAVEYAKEHKIPVFSYFSWLNVPKDMLHILKRHDCEAIILAGYLKMVPAEVVQAYKGRILNIHPALLPKYGGKGYYGFWVHEAVLAAGETESGVTVHFVNEKYDDGAIIAQRTVPIMPDDTPHDLALRVHEQELILYPQIVAALCRGEL